jgi:hypothetical protein
LKEREKLIRKMESEGGGGEGGEKLLKIESN